MQSSAVAPKKSAKDIAAEKKAEEKLKKEEAKRLEQEKKEQAKKLEQERLAKLEAERKEKERLEIVAKKLAPIQDLYATLQDDLLSLVRPLIEQTNQKHLENIENGTVEVVSEPNADVKIELSKSLQQYRLKKMKTVLTTHRNDMLKKDYELRVKEI